MKQKSNFRKNLQILGLGLLLLALTISIFLVFGTAKESIAVGRIKSIEKTGALFKSVEIQMLVESGDSIKLWEFSVLKQDTAIARCLAQSQVNNQRIKISFKEKYLRFFWQEDSRNIATSAELIGK